MSWLKNKWALPFILLLSLIVRLIYLNQSLWLDEATTAQVAAAGLPSYFNKFAPGDFHPPLFYLLEIAIGKVLGTTEIALRMISLVAGVGVVWYSYLIASAAHDEKVGKLAALFVGTSSLLVYYSQEARMYMLAALFATAAVYYFMQRRWLVFSLAIAALFLTHYVAIFILLAFWMYGIFMREGKKWWRGFVVSHFGLLAAGLAWLPIFWKQFTAGLDVESSAPLWWNILGRTTIKELLLVPSKFMLGRINLELTLPYALLVGVIGICYFLIIFSYAKTVRKEKQEKGVLVFLWFIVPLTLAALVGLRIPVFSYFRMLFVVPALFILLALGISTLKTKHAYIALAIVVLVNIASTGMYLFDKSNHREDWKGLAELVSHQGGSVIFISDSQMEAYTYYSKNEHTKFGGPALLEVSESPLWLMRYVQPIFDPGDTVRQIIEEKGYTKVAEHDFNGVVVWEYTK